MKFLVPGLIAAFTVILIWQYRRYRNARRGPAQDEQAFFYPKTTFHVLTLLHTHAGADVIEALCKLRPTLEANDQAKIVYAGQAAFVAIASDQLPGVEWNAAVLVQYPSREAYQSAAANDAYRAALGDFADTHSQGLARPVLPNLLFPLIFLGFRAFDLLTRKPARTPFIPGKPDQLVGHTAEAEKQFSKLDTLRGLSGEAVIVVNLIKAGTAKQRSADRRYGNKMAGLFAEAAHGPMHIGRAVTLEGDASFDHVALVYYPGIDYLQAMAKSTFFNEILAGKQPGDTLALPTVPVLSQLRHCGPNETSENNGRYPDTADNNPEGP